MLVELKPVWLWAAREYLISAGCTHATYTDLDIVYGELDRCKARSSTQPHSSTR